MNTLERIAKIEAELAELKAKAQAEHNKPRCDAQGRLLEAPKDGDRYYYIHAMIEDIGDFEWCGDKCDRGALAQGRCFISQPAAKAELTRLKCLQRLRGMEGYGGLKEEDGGNHAVWIGSAVALDGFDTGDFAREAQRSITSEERAAFLYREPQE